MFETYNVFAFLKFKYVIIVYYLYLSNEYYKQIVARLFILIDKSNNMFDFKYLYNMFALLQFKCVKKKTL